jgi:hypothetical protein
MTWTIQALQPKLRRQAEERSRLNEECVNGTRKLTPWRQLNFDPLHVS